MQPDSLLKRYVHATAASIVLSGALLTTADLPAKAENLPPYMAPIAGTTSSSAAATARIRWRSIPACSSFTTMPQRSS